MRVLHVRKAFSVLSETFLFDCITGLEREGIHNDVATLTRHNMETRPFDKVHVVSRPGPLHPSRVMNYVMARLRAGATDGASWPALRRRFQRLTQRLSPDVIHAHFGAEGVLIAPVARRCRIPLVVTFYGSDLSRLPRHASWRARYAGLWREATAVTVLCTAMGQDAVRLGCPPARLHVVHLGRDLETLPTRDPVHPVRHFISVGRLVEKKGHLDAVRAFERLATAHPDLRLTIIGEGPLRPDLQRLVRELRLEDRVALPGAHPSRQTIEEMRTADAFLLCSKTAADGDKEGTPTVLIEAQFIGLPCVTTRHAGIPEMIPPDNHRLLATEGNVEELAERMSYLIGGTSTTLEPIVTRGRRFAIQHFDRRVQASALRSVYESVTAERRRRPHAAP